MIVPASFVRLKSAVRSSAFTAVSPLRFTASPCTSTRPSNVRFAGTLNQGLASALTCLTASPVAAPSKDHPPESSLLENCAVPPATPHSHPSNIIAPCDDSYCASGCSEFDFVGPHCALSRAARQ